MTAITSIPTGRSPIYMSLFLQVVVALVLGIVLGVAVPGFASASNSSAMPS
jgi:aerobic C4-dicarboxylate transport protein